MADALGGRRAGRVPVGERGPGESYRPDGMPVSLVGRHQPGVATPFLDHVALGALDVRVDRVAELRELLSCLSAEAERLMAAHRVPRRRRASRGSSPDGVTVTLGLGPGLFGSRENDRFGLASRRPVALRDLPAFSNDKLDHRACGGDLCAQVCAHERELARATLARLIAVVSGGVRPRWVQEASASRAPADRSDGRPRNLLVIGRHRDSGAPLGRKREFERVRVDDLAAPPDPHARAASPARNHGVALLRRGYSYDNGTDDAGERDAGLLLLLYQRDPRRQFVPVQRRLADHDLLTPFTENVGSAAFAIPPGTRADGYVADGLLT